MGLLDSLLYSPETYGGQGGGLLDFLRNAQMQNSQYQPTQNGLSPPPATFGDDRFNALPNAPQASPDHPSQAQPIQVGGVQMPRFGNPDLYNPQQVNTPPSTQPTQGQLPPQVADANAQMPQGAPQAAPQLPPALGGGISALGRIGSPDGLIARLTGNDSRSIAQQNLKAQYDSLVPLLGPQKALLAVMNPEAGKTLLTEALTNKEHYGVISENPVEGKKYGFINEIDQTVNGKPIGAGGNGSPGGPGLLAPGVASYNPSLSGEEYMAQFSPEVQAAAKAYMNGDVMPTGNPRTQGITTLAKTVAQKYGMDTGTPVNDQTYAAKRKMQTDLASSGNSSMGGILSNGKSSFKHLAEYTESAADLGNASHNFPGGGIAAHTQNYLGNTLGGSDTQGKIKAISDNLGHYGQESTKFYAASGGGVEERTNALKQMNPATNSGEETAAYAEKEKNLMLDRFREKEAQIRDTMGEGYLQQHPVFTPELQKDIARIDASIAKMRGAQSPSSSGKPSTVIQNGHTYNLQSDGSYK